MRGLSDMPIAFFPRFVDDSAIIEHNKVIIAPTNFGLVPAIDFAIWGIRSAERLPTMYPLNASLAQNKGEIVSYDQFNPVYTYLPTVHGSPDD